MSAGYPTPAAPWSVSRARTPSGSTAETLVLIALVLQIIGGVLVLFGIAWLFGLSLVHPFAGRWVWFALTAAGVVGVLVVVFLYFAYTLCYRRIQRGEYAEAQAPTLVIGILSLFFGLIPGIFYLVGYAKLDSAIREQQGPPPVYGVPTAVPPIACTGCGRVYPVGAYAFCPACGRKLGP